MPSVVLRDPSRLQALRSTGLLDDGYDEALDRLTRLAVRTLDAPGAFITLVDADRQLFKSFAGLPDLGGARETPLTHSFCRHAVASAQPLVVEDAREHPLVRDIPPVDQLSLVAYLGVPVLSREGHALGAFCVIDDRPRRWTPGDLDLMADLAGAAASEIESRRAGTGARLNERRLTQAQALAGIGTWEWDIGSGNVAWSERTYEIFGVDPLDWAARHEDFIALVARDDRERVQRLIESALAAKRAWYEYECPIRRPDGGTRVVSVRADVEYGDDGTPLRSTGIVRDVTGERRAERELAATARRLAEAQAIAGMGSWEWQAHGGTTWSEQLFRIFGLEPGRTPEFGELLARVHPDDRDRVELVTMLAHGGDAGTYEFSCRIVRPDGELRWVEARGDIMRDAAGRAVRTTGIARDVTEARIAASRLAEAESLAGLGSWEWDLRDGTTIWSPPLFAIFGRDPAQGPLAYEDIVAAIDPSDRERAVAEIEAAMASSRSMDVSARITRADGATRWIRSRADLARDENGVLLRLFGTIQDTTDARRAEALLHEAEQRFGTAFESTTSGMALIDLEMRRFLRVNRAMCSGLGRPEEDVLAMDPTALLHPGDAGLDEDALQQLVTGERRGFEFEHRFELPDGEVRIARIHLAIVREDGGRPLYLVCHAQDLTGQREAEEQVRFHLLHHPVTKLPNRALFLDRLHHGLLQARRRGSTLAVLAVDIDRFRAVNERFGFAVGDQTLTLLGARLDDGLRDSDTVAHLGEDLFAVICEDLDDEHEALELAQRVLGVLDDELDVAEGSVRLTASIGVALATGGRSRPDDLVRDAEAAARAAYEHGGARWEIFDPALRSRLADRLELEHELRSAIERGELCLHYQPVTAWDRNSLIGFEALVRWEHPERGLLVPSAFLPIAEETGLDVPLGWFVLREACREAMRWVSEDQSWGEVGIGVNVSARQVDHPDFLSKVEATLAETGIRPSRLRLELTETDLMRSEDPVGTIERLKRLGVRVILDDFGTGYSSLSHVRRFPVDGLKIDRTFVAEIGTDPQSLQIVEAIVAMARALNLTVVVEGVETREQLDLLAPLEGTLLQGFLLGRPAPSAELGRDWRLPSR